MEMEVSLISHINRLWVLQRHAQMNDVNDGPAQDANLQPFVYQANILPTEPGLGSQRKWMSQEICHNLVSCLTLYLQGSHVAQWLKHLPALVEPSMSRISAACQLHVT